MEDKELLNFQQVKKQWSKYIKSPMNDTDRVPNAGMKTLGSLISTKMENRALKPDSRQDSWVAISFRGKGMFKIVMKQTVKLWEWIVVE